MLKQGSPEWLALREQCLVTASVGAAAAGLGRSGPQALWREKALGETRDLSENFYVRFGNAYEDACVRYYASLCPHNIEIQRFGFGIHRSFDWLGASPDRIITNMDTGRRWLLEIKTRPSGNPYDEIPLEHLVQMHIQMAVFEIYECHWACWIPGKGFFMSRVPFSQDFWDFLVPRLVQFVQAVRTKTTPPRRTKVAETNETAYQLLEKCSGLFWGESAVPEDSGDDNEGDGAQH